MFYSDYTFTPVATRFAVLHSLVILEKYVLLEQNVRGKHFNGYYHEILSPSTGM